MAKATKQSICGNCKNFKLDKDKKFFNCTVAKHGGLRYGMQVREDSQACDAYAPK